MHAKVACQLVMHHVRDVFKVLSVGGLIEEGSIIFTNATRHMLMPIVWSRVLCTHGSDMGAYSAAPNAQMALSSMPFAHFVEGYHVPGVFHGNIERVGGCFFRLLADGSENGDLRR